MAHISTFIDKPAFSLGPRIVGRANIALGAVGSAEMGTFSLAKAVGTLSSLDVGSMFLSYGSAGTHAGRVSRAAYGSFGSRVKTYQVIVGARDGSHVRLLSQNAAFGWMIDTRDALGGSVPLRVSRIANGTPAEVFRMAPGGMIDRLGTVRATLRFIYGSSAGTMRAAVVRGRLGSFSGIAVGVNSINYGSPTSPFLRINSPGGTLAFEHSDGSFVVAKLGVRRILEIDVQSPRTRINGTLNVPTTLIGGIYGSWAGTFTANLLIARGFGSFGTLTGASIRGRFGSFLQSRIATGSFGTVRSQFVRAGYGSLGTMAGRIVRAGQGSYSGLVYGRQGSFGTVSGRLFTAARGSFPNLNRPVRGILPGLWLARGTGDITFNSGGRATITTGLSAIHALMPIMFQNVFESFNVAKIAGGQGTIEGFTTGGANIGGVTRAVMWMAIGSI